MNKSELIEELTKRLNADRKTATAAVEGLIDTIVRAVNKGESVTITGFGVFEKRLRAPRVARNPRTGDSVEVEATTVPWFRPGQQFKEIVSGRKTISADEPAVKRSSEPAKKTAAKKAATAKKATPAKKTTPAKKAAAAKKAAPAKKAPTKKPAAKKTAPKKTAAKPKASGTE